VSTKGGGATRRLVVVIDHSPLQRRKLEWRLNMKSQAEKEREAYEQAVRTFGNNEAMIVGFMEGWRFAQQPSGSVWIDRDGKRHTHFAGAKLAERPTDK